MSRTTLHFLALLNDFQNDYLCISFRMVRLLWICFLGWFLFLQVSRLCFHTHTLLGGWTPYVCICNALALIPIGSLIICTWNGLICSPASAPVTGNERYEALILLYLYACNYCSIYWNESLRWNFARARNCTIRKVSYNYHDSYCSCCKPLLFRPLNSFCQLDMRGSFVCLKFAPGILILNFGSLDRDTDILTMFSFLCGFRVKYSLAEPSVNFFVHVPLMITPLLPQIKHVGASLYLQFHARIVVLATSSVFPHRSCLFIKFTQESAQHRGCL